MLFQIKKIGDKAYRIDGNPYLIAGLICFIITFLLGLFGAKGFNIAFLYAAGITIIVTPIVYVFDQVGKKKHRKILSSKLFQHLLITGFEIEKQGDYTGLIGERNQLAFRVYYDWNKLSKGFFSFGDIVIIGYFEPMVINSKERAINEELLNSLNSKYKDTFWKNKNNFSRFAPVFFIRHLNYYPFTKLDAILAEFDKIADLLKENGLTPINKKTLLERQKEYGYNYAPPIDMFKLVQVG